MQASPRLTQACSKAVPLFARSPQPLPLFRVRHGILLPRFLPAASPRSATCPAPSQHAASAAAQAHPTPTLPLPCGPAPSFWPRLLALTSSPNLSPPSSPAHPCKSRETTRTFTSVPLSLFFPFFFFAPIDPGAGLKKKLLSKGGRVKVGGRERKGKGGGLPRPH